VKRALTHDIPNFILSQVEKNFGAEAADAVHKAHDYVMYKPNPIFQILFLFIGLGSWSVYIAYAFPLIIASETVSSWHALTGFLTFLACMGSFKMACHVPPGVITARNMPKFDNYKYDDLLFTNQICPTAHIRKLPRSKFCRVTQRHIPRFDHFCSWLNQSIGEENYRYFVLFLFIQTFMCIYGAFITALLFWEQIVTMDLMNARFYNAATGEEVPVGKSVIFHYLYRSNQCVAICFFLQLILGISFILFLGFHIMLICCNMTTNEYFKWRSVKAWHKNAEKSYLQAIKEGRARGKEGIVKGEGGKAAAEELENVDVGCTGVSRKKFQKNGQDRNNDELDDTIDPGPMPTNFYNIGIKENIKEVIFPRSLRKDALIRWAKFVLESDEKEKRTRQKKD